ncbi:hypothetical protein [Sphingobacterium multivorum]|uniref:hypothetical protein n=1 Tax=Sphingobacterium multivorum TaxID=28454 RepID=UPI0028AC86B6|nr:hypothetical protein [Sphingobacterium multivorum]
MDNKKVNGVIVDYTQKVKEKVKEIYKSEAEGNKAIFLVYLINRGTNNTQGYQLNKDNHRQLFGANGQVWKNLFQPLIDNNIIMRVGAHKDGVKSESFAISNVYKWSVNDGEIKDRYTEYSSMPKYIQKFLVDGYVVASSKQTKWSKDYQYVQENKINMEAQEKITQLEFKVSILEELVQSMQEQINQLVNNNNNIVVQPSTDIEEVKKDNEYSEPQYVNDTEGNVVSSSEDVYASTLIERKNIKGADTPFFKEKEVEAENKVDFNIEAFLVPDTKNEIIFDNSDVQQVQVKEVKQVEEVIVSEKELIATRICGRHIRDIKTKKEIVKYVLTNNDISVQEIINKGISGATATRLYTELQQAI